MAAFIVYVGAFILFGYGMYENLALRHDAQTLELQWVRQELQRVRQSCNSTNPFAYSVEAYAFSSPGQQLVRSAQGPSLDLARHGSEAVQRTAHTVQQQLTAGLDTVAAVAAGYAQYGAAQRHRLLAEASKLHAATASWVALLADTFAPAPVKEGPLSEEDSLAQQQPQQQSQQQEAPMDAWVFHRLAYAAARPQLWQQIIQHQQEVQFVKTFAAMAGFSPAAPATVATAPRPDGTQVVSCFITVLPSQQAMEVPAPLVSQPPAANTTCTLQEAPARPMPAAPVPAPQAPESCALPTLASLLSEASAASAGCSTECARAGKACISPEELRTMVEANDLGLVQAVRGAVTGWLLPVAKQAKVSGAAAAQALC